MTRKNTNPPPPPGMVKPVSPPPPGMVKPVSPPPPPPPKVGGACAAMGTIEEQLLKSDSLAAFFNQRFGEKIRQVKDPPVLFAHNEAYMLMRYRCQGCEVIEIVWNARDGVTPFGIGCLACDGGTMNHIDWKGDRRVRNYFPKKGQRVFVDMSPGRYEVIIRARVASAWELNYMDARKVYGSKEEMFMALRQEPMKVGTPDIMTVGV